MPTIRGIYIRLTRKLKISLDLRSVKNLTKKEKLSKGFLVSLNGSLVDTLCWNERDLCKSRQAELTTLKLASKLLRSAGKGPK